MLISQVNPQVDFVTLLSRFKRYDKLHVRWYRSTGHQEKSNVLAISCQSECLKWAVYTAAIIIFLVRILS